MQLKKENSAAIEAKCPPIVKGKSMKSENYQLGKRDTSEVQSRSIIKSEKSFSN